VRIAVTGAGGQLGRSIRSALSDVHDVRSWEHSEVDVTDAVSVADAVSSIRPDAIIHTAAWTDVDGCERDPDRAYAINALGAEHVARAARKAQAHLILVSTDFVFDGFAAHPYDEDSATNPLQVYGRTKLHGEHLALDTAPRCTIVRTAWLHDPAVPAGFTAGIIRAAEQGSPFMVVADQVGSPTTTGWFAQQLAEIAETRTFGILHRVEIDQESRADFARRYLASRGLDATLVLDAATEEMPARPARRPKFAPLTSVRSLHVEHAAGDGCDC
jgi:dTDP-4-dehydrorhamnose reductase